MTWAHVHSARSGYDHARPTDEGEEALDECPQVVHEELEVLLDQPMAAVVPAHTQHASNTPAMASINGSTAGGDARRRRRRGVGHEAHQQKQHNSAQRRRVRVCDVCTRMGTYACCESASSPLKPAAVAKTLRMGRQPLLMDGALASSMLFTELSTSSRTCRDGVIVVVVVVVVVMIMEPLRPHANGHGADDLTFIWFSVINRYCIWFSVPSRDAALLQTGRPELQ